MERLLENIQIQVAPEIYLKDPYSSDLGKKILSEGIVQLREMGLENFTFRKLAVRIGTTESSIYRYFESKQKLLMYLHSWYWSWLEYRLVFSLMNIQSATQKIETAIELFCQDIDGGLKVGSMDLSNLQQIVITESAMSSYAKMAAEGDQKAYFTAYLRLLQRFAELIREINPQYPRPDSLAATILEGIFHQKFLKHNLPALGETANAEDLARFFTHIVLSTTSSKK